MGILQNDEYVSLRRTPSLSDFSETGLERFHKNPHTLRRVESVPNVHDYRSIDAHHSYIHKPRGLHRQDRHSWAKLEWPFEWSRRHMHPSYVYEYYHRPLPRYGQNMFVDSVLASYWWHPSHSYPLNYTYFHDRPFWGLYSGNRPCKRYHYPYYFVPGYESRHRFRLSHP